MSTSKQTYDQKTIRKWVEERNGVDFLYQDQKENSENSTFHKFVNRK